MLLIACGDDGANIQASNDPSSTSSTAPQQTTSSSSSTSSTAALPSSTTQAPTTTTKPTDWVVMLASHDHDAGPANLGTVEIAGDAFREGGCVWIRQTGSDVAVRWPKGTKAHFFPQGGGTAFTLIASDGREVGGPGDKLEIAGFWTEPGRLDRCHVGTDKVMNVLEIGPG